MNAPHIVLVRSLGLNFFIMVRRILELVKGNGFKIDPNIPTTYLLNTIISRIIYLLYGMIRFRTIKSVYIHPSATIKCISKITIGRGFSMAKNCYIDALSEHGMICGDNVTLGYNTFIELTGSLRTLGKGMIIGNNVGLGTHGRYGSGAGIVEIGDNTIFGNYVSIHPENHISSDISTPIREQGVYSKGGVKIGANCWIGAKVTILDGTELGDGCIVAAGAVVTGKFPSNSMIGGVPAKIIKMRS